MAGTINIANVAIGFDPSKLKAGIDLSRKEINQLNKNLRESLDPVTKMGLEVYQLSEALRVGAIGAERFDAAYEVIAKKFGVITPKAKAEAQALERLAAAEKKAADNAAYLDRLKKNSKEMELRDKEKFRDDEERQRIALQQRGSQVTQNAQTELERYIASKKELKQLLNSNNISQETYNRTLSDMRANLSWNIDATKKENEFQKQGLALKQQAMTATERYAASVRNLQQHLQANNITQKEYNELLKKAKDESSRGGGIAGMSIGRLTLGGVGAMAGYQALSMFTQGLEAVTLGSIRLRAELEMSETAFKLLTGSVREAETILKEMRKLDKESPLDFMAIQRAGKTFIGYGLEVKKLIPMLTSLSKVSLGNTERFELLSLAMAQVASRGKLAGDEVRQMVNQGFNPLLAIAESLSKELGGKPVQYMDRLRKDMEAGLISFDMVYSALQNLTNGTGRFAEVNKESLDNVQGKWNKLLSTINETRLAIGKAIEPATKAVLDQALANPAKQKVTPGGVMIGNMGPEAMKAYEEELIKQEKWRKGMDRAAQAQKEMQEQANQTSVAKQQEEAKKKKEQEDKQQQQKELRERLEKETEKINVDIAGQARRLGMTPKQAMLDEKFFDLIKKVGSAFSANSVEVKKLNDLMAKAGKQFDEELKVKEKEIQDKANEKTKNLQDKFNEWLRKSSNPDGITSNKTEMLQRDSVEAYKFLIKQQDTLEKRREEIAERQKDLTEEIRDINKKMQEDMKDAPRLVKI